MSIGGGKPELPAWVAIIVTVFLAFCGISYQIGMLYERVALLETQRAEDHKTIMQALAEVSANSAQEAAANSAQSVTNTEAAAAITELKKAIQESGRHR